MVKGLIIRRPWIDLILSGQKTWEMRGKDTLYRGPLCLIEGGSGRVVGATELVGTRRLLPEEFSTTLDFHQVDTPELLVRWPVAWQLQNSWRYPTPITYSHPKGAVVWVNLPDECLLVAQ